MEQELDASYISSPLLGSLLSLKLVEKCHTGISIDHIHIGAKTTRGIYAISSLTTGTHFYTNGINRNVAHASRIARHICGKPVHSTIHVAVILPGDLGFWIDAALKLISFMVKKDIFPFLYCLADHETIKGSRSDSLSRCGRVDATLRPTSPEDPGGPNVSLQYQCRRLGISLKYFSYCDPTFVLALKDDYIDMGLLFGPKEGFETTSAPFRSRKIRTNETIYLLSKVHEAVVSGNESILKSIAQAQCSEEIVQIVLSAVCEHLS